MKQPKIHIIDINGKDWGIKNIMSCSWHSDGTLWVVVVNFMETNNSNDYSSFYNYERDGKFKNVHGNLIGTLI